MGAPEDAASAAIDSTSGKLNYCNYLSHNRTGLTPASTNMANSKNSAQRPDAAPLTIRHVEAIPMMLPLKKPILMGGGQRFERIEDVIDPAELAAISDRYKEIAGYSVDSVGR